MEKPTKMCQTYLNVIERLVNENNENLSDNLFTLNGMINELRQELENLDNYIDGVSSEPPINPFNRYFTYKDVSRALGHTKFYCIEPQDNGNGYKLSQMTIVNDTKIKTNRCKHIGEKLPILLCERAEVIKEDGTKGFCIYPRTAWNLDGEKSDLKPDIAVAAAKVAPVVDN